MTRISDKEQWIADTQMFQRLAGVTESSAIDLGKEWDSFKTRKRRSREVQRTQEHLIIQHMAICAASQRTN